MIFSLKQDGISIDFKKLSWKGQTNIETIHFKVAFIIFCCSVYLAVTHILLFRFHFNDISNTFSYSEKISDIH